MRRGWCSTFRSIRGWRPGPARCCARDAIDTLQTCAQRFANAVNFRGEPFVPGNDLVARYPVRRS